MTDGIRLAKRVAALLGCSRSDAERLVLAGRVRVDGEVVDLPEARVGDHQQVVVDAAAVPAPVAPATLLLHQPAGLSAEAAFSLLQEAHHWDADPNAMPLQRQHLRGCRTLLPLPPEASGLAVFSQHTGIVRRLSDPAAPVEQELLVDVAGTLAEGGLARLAHGLQWHGRPLPPARVSWQSEHRLRFAAKGIDPAQVPWMCTQVGLQATSLRRLRIGRLPLAALPPGRWRWLQPAERF